MAIHFERYENRYRRTAGREKAPCTHHVQWKIGTDYVRRKIQERCSLTETTDVTAVLDALSHVVGQGAGWRSPSAPGRDRLFHPTLKCIEGWRKRNAKIRKSVKGIKFRADQALKNEVGPWLKISGTTGKFPQTIGCGNRYAFANLFRTSINDPCGLQTRIYEVESDGAYPQAEAEGRFRISEYLRNRYMCP